MDGIFRVQGYRVILAYWEVFWISQHIVYIEASERKVLELQVPLH